MTHRESLDLYGHPGRLLYLPMGVDQADDESAWYPAGKWGNATRPVLTQIEKFESWHRPEDPLPTDTEITFNKAWHRKGITQKRWLYGACPEAFAASAQLNELITEEKAWIPPKARRTPTRNPLLVVGQAERRTDDSVEPHPILVSAAGPGGTIVRFNVLSRGKRSWQDHASISLKTYSPVFPEEVLWSGHAPSTVTNIKFAQGQGSKQLLRLVLVQRTASTTVFMPILHKVPVLDPLGASGQKPSFLDPNPLFSLSTRKTGGSVQTDVAFNPCLLEGTRRQDAQVSIIDEGGYWSVWDMRKSMSSHTKSKYRPSLRKCGHISRGFMTQPPDDNVPNGDTHSRLLWLTQRPSRQEPVEAPGSDARDMRPEVGAARGDVLLVCNSFRMRLFRLDDGDASPILPVSTGKIQDRILDLKGSPLSASQAFVLTEKTLRLIEVWCRKGDRVDASSLRTTMSIPHGRTEDDSLILGILDDKPDLIGRGVCVVYLYSAKVPRVDIFWVRVIASEPPSYQFIAQSFALSDRTTLDDKVVGGGFQSLSLVSCPFRKTKRKGSAGGPGLSYFENSVQFFQILAQGKRLEIEGALATLSSSSDDSVFQVPEIGLYPRYREIQDLSSLVKHAFVVPDPPTSRGNQGPNRSRSLVRRLENAPTIKKAVGRRNIKMLFKQFIWLWREPELISEDDLDMAPSGWSPSRPFFTIVSALKDDESGGLPRPIQLTTLREISWRFNVSKPIEAYVQEWGDALASLRNHEFDFTVSPVGVENGDREEDFHDPTDLLALHTRISALFVNTRNLPSKGRHEDLNQVAKLAAKEAACDIFLSSFTIINSSVLKMSYPEVMQCTASAWEPSRSQSRQLDPWSQSQSQSRYTPQFQRASIAQTDHMGTIYESPRSTPAPAPYGSQRQRLSSIGSPDPDRGQYICASTTPVPSQPQNQSQTNALSRLLSLAPPPPAGITPKSVKTSTISLLSQWQLGADPAQYTWSRDGPADWFLRLREKQDKDNVKKTRRRERYAALDRLWAEARGENPLLYGHENEPGTPTVLRRSLWGDRAESAGSNWDWDGGAIGRLRLGSQGGQGEEGEDRAIGRLALFGSQGRSLGRATGTVTPRPGFGVGSRSVPAENVEVVAGTPGFGRTRLRVSRTPGRAEGVGGRGREMSLSQQSQSQSLSQPQSGGKRRSESVGVSMSQPVAGSFGSVLATKRVKRSTGF